MGVGAIALVDSLIGRISVTSHTKLGFEPEKGLAGDTTLQLQYQAQGLNGRLSLVARSVQPGSLGISSQPRRRERG